MAHFQAVENGLDDEIAVFLAVHSQTLLNEMGAHVARAQKLELVGCESIQALANELVIALDQLASDGAGYWLEIHDKESLKVPEGKNGCEMFQILGFIVRYVTWSTGDSLTTSSIFS